MGPFQADAEKINRPRASLCETLPTRGSASPTGKIKDIGDNPDYIMIPTIPDQKLYSDGHHGNEFTFEEKKYQIDLKSLLVAVFVQGEKTKNVLQSALIKVQLEK